MTHHFLSRCKTGVICIAVVLSTVSWSAFGNTSALPQKTLTAFKDEAELSEWLKQQHERYENVLRSRRAVDEKSMPLAAAMAPTAVMQESAVPPAEDSVTNTQTAGVDEGGIVKVYGNYLVILRRGRLFTIDIGEDKLESVSVINAFGAGINPRGSWYDEMLISGSTIIVIGYSYARGGTEIGLFNIDPQGHLSYRATYVLRSNDYYSSRNYASRLIGDKLIFYTPLHLSFHNKDPYTHFPAMRKITGEEMSDFKRIAPATKIYRTDQEFDSGATLHTVQVCDLSQPEMTCEATAILGDAGREFYVSKDAVYVWVTPQHWRYNRQTEENKPVLSSVFRMPLDGAAPSGIKTMGSPIDQFSFLETPDRKQLNVLLRAEGPLKSMWASEVGSNHLAFLRLPITQFGDATDSVPIHLYTPVPAPARPGSLQNRYIGNFLLYGSGQTWRRRNNTDDHQGFYSIEWTRPEMNVKHVPLKHSVDRIEALGQDAIVVGTNNQDLYFTAISLPNPTLSARSYRLPNEVEVISEYVMTDASQGETRSHGFFYRSDGPHEGVLGLPIRGGNSSGWQQLTRSSASIIFLRNDALQLSTIGNLNASENTKEANQDNCQASCIDWYGNSRPLFIRERVFALMGYEIVEGSVRLSNAKQVKNAQSIQERRRINFAPIPTEINR